MQQDIIHRILTDYSDLAAYEDCQVNDGVQALLNDPKFIQWTAPLGLPLHLLNGQSFPTRYHADMALTFPFLTWVESKTCSAVTLVGEENLIGGQFFLSNHRDIILDSAFLAFCIWKKKQDRVYIGLGNNLLKRPWIEHLVRVNGGYIIKRDGTPRELLASSRRLSEYIHLLQAEGRSLWLAQREGRAKDGDDRTQPAVLKMLTMADKSDFLTAVEAMRITPVAITYEYDACDFLKAREMQLKRDFPDYQKDPSEDLINMQTGLVAWKGEASYVVTPALTHDELSAIAQQSDLRNEQARLVAELIDRRIHTAYRIAWTNQAAYDLQQGICNEGTAKFEAYLQQQLAKIDLPNKDEAYLRDCMIGMYAKPLENQRAAMNV